MIEDLCIFCEILAERSNIILETRFFFVIHDKYPATRGHCLIISKTHHKDLFALDWVEWADLFHAIQRTKHMLDEAFHPDGYNVRANCGEAAGQTIFHLHFHCIPQYADDPNSRGGIRSFSPPPLHYEKT